MSNFDILWMGSVLGFLCAFALGCLFAWGFLKSGRFLLMALAAIGLGSSAFYDTAELAVQSTTVDSNVLPFLYHLPFAVGLISLLFASRTFLQTKRSPGVDTAIWVSIAVVTLQALAVMAFDISLSFGILRPAVIIIVAVIILFAAIARAPETVSAGRFAFGGFVILLGGIARFLSETNVIAAPEDGMKYSLLSNLPVMILMAGCAIIVAAFAHQASMQRVSSLRDVEERREKMRRAEEKQRFKEASEHAHTVRVLNREKELEAELRKQIAERSEAMRKAKDAAEELANSRQSFIGFMSHEIRTPLNGILGMARLLMKTKLQPEQRKYAQTLSYSGEALVSLVNDVLDLSKIEAGQMQLESIDFDLIRLLDNAVDLMHGRADERGIYLKTAIADNVPRFVMGDPTRLRQIILNLVSNAIKFTEQGGVTIRVRRKPEHDNTNNVDALYFEIIDTGIGIPDEAKPKLFGEYQQVGSSTSRMYGGTGLGLNICRKLVHAMHGDIGFDSTLGKGTVFWFYADFPMGKPVYDDNDDDSETLGNARNLAEKSLPSLSVLVVEDDAISQQVMSSYLRLDGHRPETAKDGETALRMIAEMPFDVALMDVNMPGMSGMDVTRAIRALGDAVKSTTPIIAITGNVGADDIEKCLSAGMNDFVGKPVDPDALRSALRRIWQNRQDTTTVSDSEEERGATVAEDDFSLAGAVTAPMEDIHTEIQAKAAQLSEIENQHADDNTTEHATVPLSFSDLEDSGETMLRPILIVEDDPISQQVVSGYLAHDGHNVQVVGDGLQAVEQAQSSQYATILMDIELPGINGIEATRRIRALTDPEKAHVPIIAITGNVTPDYVDACREAGMNDFLSKPVDPGYLRSALLRVAKRPENDFADEDWIAAQVKAGEEVKISLESERSLNILVIEDDPISQRIVTGYLARSGHTVFMAGDAESGLEHVKNDMIDVVLMDVDLPGISGLEATRRIRAMPEDDKRKTPIIAITGNVSEQDVEACRVAGMNDFVGKPISPDYLRSAIIRVRKIDEDEQAGNGDSPENLAVLLDAGTLAHLLRAFDLNVLKDLITQSTDLSAEAVITLDNAAQNQDRIVLKSESHKLKGMARNMGLDALGKLASEIEELAPAGDIARIRSVIEDMPYTLEQSQIAIERWLETASQAL